MWPSCSIFMAAAATNSSALDAELLQAGHSWVTVAASMSANFTKPLHFNSTGFDFKAFAPSYNGNIIERDAAAGLAFIFMQCAARFGVAEPFTTAATAALTYLQSLQPSDTVLYEILAVLAPLTAARMTAEAGSPPVDVLKLLNFAVTPNGQQPLSRPDWGVIIDTWNGVEVSGLVGSTSDSSGYGFAFNTYSTVAALLPVVRYNASFARSLAAFGLFAASSARLFLRDYVGAGQQDSRDWSLAHDEAGAISYEGVRHFGPSVQPYNQQGPWATGDFIREHGGGGVNLCLCEWTEDRAAAA